jgi:acetoin utilization deacetylase AcuC-like enzyme
VHPRAYLDGLAALAGRGGGMLDPDTVLNAASWEAALGGAGSLLDATRYALESGRHAFVAVRPPGHHALASRAMGFCLLANVVIGAREAQALGRERVLIVDWDVHHGNGTQALVENEPDIHFVSMHQWPWYPGTGPADDRGPHGTVWNVPMPAGLPREEYVRAFEGAIDAATRGFVPDLILISAGFDSLAGDPLGGFTLEVEDFESLTHSLVARANSWCGGRLVSALEGGYAPDRLAQASVRHLAALAA